MVEKPQKSCNLWSFYHLVWFLFTPVVKEAKYKNLCIKYSTKGALTKFNKDNIEENLLKETGLTIDDLSKIEGYKNCID